MLWRLPGCRALHWLGLGCSGLVLGSLTLGCASVPCKPGSTGEPDVSLTYISGGPAGLQEQIEYYENGLVVLGAMNGETYCSEASPSVRRELEDLLEQGEVERALDRFGDNLRYPDCFIQEELSIEIRGHASAARIDALNGLLLSIVERLDRVAKDEFGRKYMTSIVERATDWECQAGRSAAPLGEEVEEVPRR